jgi:K+-transporting ATPase ATPase C chain
MLSQALLSQIRAALAATLLFTLILGVGYPLAATGIAQLAFPRQADGSLIRDASGAVIGSALIAQKFERADYLHSRPSAAGADGYDASGSSGSNLGPTNPALAERMVEAATALKGEGGARIPADAVTTSASGLDPHISPENARRQAARIAAARGVPEADVRRVIDARVVPPALGIFGQPTVNVLETNLALDAAVPRRQPPAS